MIGVKSIMPCVLTRLELDCVKAFADGMTAKAVAWRLKMTPQAVNSRIGRAKARTKSGTIAGLVALALRNGWIE